MDIILCTRILTGILVVLIFIISFGLVLGGLIWYIVYNPETIIVATIMIGLYAKRMAIYQLINDVWNTLSDEEPGSKKKGIGRTIPHRVPYIQGRSRSNRQKDLEKSRQKELEQNRQSGQTSACLPEIQHEHSIFDSVSKYLWGSKAECTRKSRSITGFLFSSSSSEEISSKSVARKRETPKVPIPLSSISSSRSKQNRGAQILPSLKTKKRTRILSEVSGKPQVLLQQKYMQPQPHIPDYVHSIFNSPRRKDWELEPEYYYASPSSLDYSRKPRKIPRPFTTRSEYHSGSQISSSFETKTRISSEVFGKSENVLFGSNQTSQSREIMSSLEDCEPRAVFANVLEKREESASCELVPSAPEQLLQTFLRQKNLGEVCNIPHSSLSYQQTDFNMSELKYQCASGKLREYISQTIVKGLVEEIDKINAKLTMMGLADFQIGVISISTVKTLSEKLPKESFPTFKEIVPYLESTTNQEYFVYRLRELAEGSCMKVYRHDKGGSFRGKCWTKCLITDSAIIAHLFCAYMDYQLPYGVCVFEKKCFSYQYFKKANIQKVPPGQGYFIYQYKFDPPMFCVVIDGVVYDVPEGQNNLFHAISLFLAYVKKKQNGFLEHVHLGTKGLNILHVLE